MNRRNFILGLGTAATLSGAASVTGATLSDTVQPGADFRVVATDNLEVRQNANLDAGNSPDQENYTTVSPSNIDFNETAGTGNPNMTVDSGTNDELDMALATVNDQSAGYNNNETNGGDLPYANSSVTNVPGEGGEAPLEVENPTAEAQEIAVSYNFGNDVGGGSDEVAEETVLGLFEFYMVEADSSVTASNGESGVDAPNNYTQISADDTTLNPQSGGTLTQGNGGVLASGSTKQVHLQINMDSGTQAEIQNAADPAGVGGFDGGATDDVALLNSVEFGVIN